jgi:hypothetical protein
MKLPVWLYYTILVFRWKSETAALCWAAYAIRAAHGNPSSPLQGLPAEIDELQKVTLRLFEEKVFQPMTTRGYDSAYSVWSDLPKYSIQHWQNIPGPSKSSSVGYIIFISLYYSKTLKEYITYYHILWYIVHILQRRAKHRPGPPFQTAERDFT